MTSKNNKKQNAGTQSSYEGAAAGFRARMDRGDPYLYADLGKPMDSEHMREFEMFMEFELSSKFHLGATFTRDEEYPPEFSTRVPEIVVGGNSMPTVAIGEFTNEELNLLKIKILVYEDDIKIAQREKDSEKRDAEVIRLTERLDATKTEALAKEKELVKAAEDNLERLRNEAMSSWVRTTTEAAARKHVACKESLPLIFTWLHKRVHTSLRVALETVEPEFHKLTSAVEAQKDPLALWRIIRRACRLGVHATQNNAFMVLHQKTVCDQLRQTHEESLAAWAARYKGAHETAKQMGFDSHRGMDASIVVMDFLQRTDERFGAAIAALRNAEQMQGVPLPSTISGAVASLCLYEDPTQRPRSGPTLTEAVFTAHTEKPTAAPRAEDEAKKKKPERKGKGKSSEAKSNSSRFKCYNCGGGGHKASVCPSPKQEGDRTSNKTTSLVTVVGDDHPMNAGLFEACFAVCEGVQLFQPDDVLLDTQSTVHVFRNKAMLTNIRSLPDDETLTMTGVTGDSIKIGEMGVYQGIKRVYLAPTAIANILSYASLKPLGIKERGAAFVMPSPTGCGPDWCFILRGGRYVLQRTEGAVLATTVAENESKYTAREVAAARAAKELERILGYPSVRDMRSLAATHSGLPSPADIDRSVEIYGTSEGAIKGKLTRKKPSAVSTDELLARGTDLVQDVILCADLFFIDRLVFILTISRRLCMLTVHHIATKSAVHIEPALRSVIHLYKQRGFKVRALLTDGESAIRTLQPMLLAEGVAHSEASRGAHVPEVERAIRSVKERCRAIWSTLPFKALPPTIIAHMVQYAVVMLNLVPKANMVGGGMCSPRELFSGLKVNVSELKLGFADYVQVYTGETESSLKPRSFPALVLLPVLFPTQDGNYRFYNLETGAVVSRSNYKALPVTQSVINMVAARVAADQRSGSFEDAGLNDEVVIDDTGYEPLPVVEPAEHVPRIAEPQTSPPDPAPTVESDSQSPRSPDPQIGYVGDAVSDHHLSAQHEVEVAGVEAPEEPEPAETTSLGFQPRTVVEDGVQHQVRRSTRTRRPWHETHNAVLLNMSAKTAIKKLGEPAEKALESELRQMVEKGVFHPVHKVPPGKSALPSHAFTAQKRCGRVKSRLVADGSRQDKAEAGETSSPTAATEALFVVAALAAKEHRHVWTMDVEGAYLHAPMTNEVYIRLEKLYADILVKIDNNYAKFVKSNGQVVVRLDRALYGLVESARLFYEHISTKLNQIGFLVNSYDSCVFSKTVGRDRATIVLYVDDLFLTTTSMKLGQEVIQELKNAYKHINAKPGPFIDYLGMTFDFSSPGKVTIGMKNYVRDIAEALDKIHGPPGDRFPATPAQSELFEVNANSDALSRDKTAFFQAAVAKLLYMAKRGRPDMLTAVSFLTTRVKEPTAQDWSKLCRALRYLQGSQDLVLTLGAGEKNDSLVLSAFVDASYGTHPMDGKSHSGVAVTLGQGVFASRSNKQKLVTRSSTEAELVAVADVTAQVLWLRNLLIELGYDLPAARIGQDNQSTIALLEKGRSTNKATKHIAMRFFFIHDRIKSGEVELVYVPTEDMVGDFFTKALQGEQFRKMRKMILHIEDKDQT